MQQNNQTVKWLSCILFQENCLEIFGYFQQPAKHQTNHNILDQSTLDGSNGTCILYSCFTLLLRQTNEQSSFYRESPNFDRTYTFTNRSGDVLQFFKLLIIWLKGSINLHRIIKK